MILIARWLGRAALAVPVGVVAVIVLTLTAPLFFGMRSFTVVSGSMHPTILAGDVVLSQRVAPLSARVGDVITFSDPNDKSRLVTHRLRTIEVEGEKVSMTTKGDANNTTERWVVPADGHIGKVVLDIPRLGYALAWTRSRYAQLVLIAIPALLLAGWEVMRIWRRPPPRVEADALA